MKGINFLNNSPENARSLDNLHRRTMPSIFHILLQPILQAGKKALRRHTRSAKFEYNASLPLPIDNRRQYPEDNRGLILWGDFEDLICGPTQQFHLNFLGNVSGDVFWQQGFYKLLDFSEGLFFAVEIHGKSTLIIMLLRCF